MLVGAARNLIEGGQLFRIPLSRGRGFLAPTDPRLADRVADNEVKYGITESESLLFGKDFGVATDIRTETPLRWDTIGDRRAWWEISLMISCM